MSRFNQFGVWLKQTAVTKGTQTGSWVKQVATSRSNQFGLWLAQTPSFRLVRRPSSFLRGARESALVLGLVPLAAFALIATGGVAAATAPLPTATQSVSDNRDGSEETEALLSIDQAETEEGLAVAREAAEDEPENNVGSLEQAIATFGQPDFVAILSEMFPGAQWTLDGSSYSGLTWVGPGPKPSEAQLLAQWPAVAQKIADRRSETEEAERQSTAQRQIERDQRAADPARRDLCESFDYNALYGGDYARVLAVHYPGAQWTLDGSSYAGLTWIGPGGKPSKTRLDGLMDGVALQQCLQRPMSELRARAGTSETEEYVAGVLRPRGYSDNSFTPSLANCRLLPQVPHDGGGGSTTIYIDPASGKNFEQVVGMSAGDFSCRLAQAHGWFGGQYSVSLSIDNSRKVIWYSSQVRASTVRSLLSSLGAELTPPPAPPPAPEPGEDAPADDPPADDLEMADDTPDNADETE